jgi:hypothetical protein
MLIGGIAIVVMLFMPMGLAGLPGQLRDRIHRRRRKSIVAVPGSDEG